MSRARTRADGTDLTAYAPLASPVLVTPNLGTPSAGVVTNLSGVLPVGVTGGSGLTALGAVASGNISHADIVFPAGHIVQIRTASTTTSTNFGAGAGTWTVVTGMNHTITPLFPDSKILIHFNCGGMVNGAANAIGTKITGTTTGDVQIQSRYGYSSATTWIPVPFAVTAIDTPGNILTQAYYFYVNTQVSLAASNAIANSDGGGNTNAGTTILYEIKEENQ